MTLIPDCGNDAAAYVLGALDSHELDTFARHLERCSVCQVEVESFQQLVNVLPESVPQYAATKSLRRRVMADVRADILRNSPAVHARDRRSLGGLGTGSDWVPAWARTPVPRFHAGLVGSAVAVVLVLAVVLVGLTAGGTRTKAKTFYKAEVGNAELVTAGGHPQLIVHHLTQLPDTSTYEVWLESPGGRPQPTRVLFNTDANGNDAVAIPNSLSGITKILVTRERAGGSVVPSKFLVVSADI